MQKCKPESSQLWRLSLRLARWPLRMCFKSCSRQHLWCNRQNNSQWLPFISNPFSCKFEELKPSLSSKCEDVNAEVLKTNQINEFGWRLKKASRPRKKCVLFFSKGKIQYTRWEIVDFSCKNVILVGYHVRVVGFGRKSLKLEFESKMERQFISALRPEHFSDNLD